MWKLFFFTALLIASASCTPNLRQILTGDCVNRCTLSTNIISGGCPFGSECRTNANGCGKSCHLVDDLFKRVINSSPQKRQLGCITQLCFIMCPFGQAVDAMGCTLCSCA